VNPASVSRAPHFPSTRQKPVPLQFASVKATPIPAVFNQSLEAGVAFRTSVRLSADGSSGSGVVVKQNTDGSFLIATNQHVLGKGATAGTKVSVTLSDGRQISGVVVVSQRPGSPDLALVKIPSTDSVEVGRIALPRVGEFVVASGYPFDGCVEGGLCSGGFAVSSPAITELIGENDRANVLSR
jgi:hypothetical protein